LENQDIPAALSTLAFHPRPEEAVAKRFGSVNA
jgi:hypothetical protein